MGSRADGCQTLRSSGPRPGIQGPEASASRKHHGISRAPAQTWSRATFAIKETGRTVIPGSGLKRICPTIILKGQCERAGLGFAADKDRLLRLMVRTRQAYA